MNRDDIIRMAREAGFLTRGVQQFAYPPTSLHITYELERFASLVAAASASVEREACVNIIETYRIPVGNSAAGEMACEWTYGALKEIRDDIRARGTE